MAGQIRQVRAWPGGDRRRDGATRWWATMPPVSPAAAIFHTDHEEASTGGCRRRAARPFRRTPATPITWQAATNG
jgi:hypothetical protein